MRRPGITLPDGSFYPHSFSLADLDELALFIGQHERTITLAEFARGDRDPGAICVRHDVDHSAAHALRFAEWEHEHRIRSTYFLLPTADYYSDGVREYGVAIQALGHEVGVHADAYTVTGEPLAALRLLREWADEMRSWGLEIVGCADHGGGEPRNVDLWRELGHSPFEASFEYEAYLLHGMETNYISDNRGSWRAPLERRPDRPTHVLAHPEHWELP